MNNVKHSNIIVNGFSEKNIKIIRDYILLRPELEKYTDIKYDYKTNTKNYDFIDTPQGIKENCPLSIPLEFTKKQHLVNRKGKKRRPPSVKYEKMYKNALSGFVSDPQIVSTFKQRLEERALIFYKSKDNNSSVFYGTNKGSDYYNKILTDKVNHSSSLLASRYSHFYFLTFTYAYNIYGTNLINSWKLFNNQLKVIFKSLRRKYKMGYVMVLEATKKGYPHAHLILAVNNPLVENHDSLKDGEQIKSGSFYDYIKKHVNSPVFNLQKAGKAGLVKYLGKYISKSSEKVLEKNLSKFARLSDCDRKALLSCLMPVLAEVRQYRFSIRDNKKPVPVNTSQIDSDCEELENLVKLKFVSPEGDSLLISLLNKLTKFCHSTTWIMTDRGNINHYKNKVGYYSGVPEEIISIFEKKGSPIGCAGCVVTDLLKLLLKNGFNKENLTGLDFASHMYRAKNMKFVYVGRTRFYNKKYSIVKPS